MLNNSILSKYADVLCDYSLKLKDGDKLLIRSTTLGENLVRAVYKKALICGAYPDIEISIEGIERLKYDWANDKQLKYTSGLNKYTMENYDCLLHIDADYNLKELESVAPAKKQLKSESRKEIIEIFTKRAAAGELRWTICQYPVLSCAQESSMSLSEYENFIYNACGLFEESPIKYWQNVYEKQEILVNKLNNYKTFRFLGEGIDVSFSTKNRTWINSCGVHNMPSGEVFTSPVENSVNGFVTFTYPGIYMGSEVEGIEFEIKDGEIIKWNAKKGKSLLDSLMSIEGAKRFGEIAVGTNYNIKKFTKNILFDEKIGGTIHMAIGNSYPETGGQNKCSIHWDLIADMHNNSKIFADDKVIYENGKFII